MKIELHGFYTGIKNRRGKYAHKIRKVFFVYFNRKIKNRVNSIFYSFK